MDGVLSVAVNALKGFRLAVARPRVPLKQPAGVAVSVETVETLMAGQYASSTMDGVRRCRPPLTWSFRCCEPRLRFLRIWRAGGDDVLRCQRSIQIQRIWVRLAASD